MNGDGPIAFATAVLRGAAAVSLRPGLWIPAVAFSFAADLTAVGVAWPFRDDVAPPAESAITTMVLLILAKAWFSLTLARIALAEFRGQVAGVLNQWVPVTAALRIGFVSLVLLAPILLGFVLLVVPGLYLLARWSQATLLLVDGEARWFDAAEKSHALTAGYRGAILVILTAVAAVALPVGAVVQDIALLAWAWRAAESTFGAALAAGLYHHLTIRAPWNDTR